MYLPLCRLATQFKYVQAVLWLAWCTDLATIFCINLRTLSFIRWSNFRRVSGGVLRRIRSEEQIEEDLSRLHICR